MRNPHVVAVSFSGGSVYLAADRSLIVFTDESCSEVKFTYTFDSSINCFTLSDDGLFVIVGIESAVHCLYPSAKGQLLFSRYTYLMQLCKDN